MQEYRSSLKAGSAVRTLAGMLISPIHEDSVYHCRTQMEVPMSLRFTSQKQT